jgi:MFS family permease
MEAPPVSDQDDADRPATFREVLASGEYRALYLASALSWFGDYVARAAVTSLVYQKTGSVAASAATFAISYVPWLGLGPILAALADRLPFRRTMITSDVLRMILIALVALPGMPIWGMIALLFATAVCNPPFDAARSALLSQVLRGDRYVVGMTLQTTSHQAAQVAGYLSGAGLSAINPQAALLFNSLTFGVSGLLVALQIAHRPPSLAKEDRTHLLRETASGLKLVFTAPLLRGVATLVFLTALFAVVPDGLAAAWAAELSPNEQARGWIQGAIMIANPIGFILGGLVVGRVLGPKRRQRVIRLFAFGVPASLIPALLGPPIIGVVALCFLCGVATAGLIPATNGLFVQALPNAYRARAFGVMKSGIQVLQGVGVFVTGWLADRFPLHMVVGVWGLMGVGLVAVSIVTWPNAEQIDAEIARAKELNAASEADAADAAEQATTKLPGQDHRQRPRPRRALEPEYGFGLEPDGDLWASPGTARRVAAPAVGRARVVHRASDDDQALPAASDPGGGYRGGRHSADDVRRRISRPVGRIYSTESARSRLVGPPTPEGQHEPEPAHEPERPDIMTAADAAGLLTSPTSTEPPWLSPADVQVTPEQAAAAHHRALQQHAAHQHALNRRRAEETQRDER